MPDQPGELFGACPGDVRYIELANDDEEFAAWLKSLDTMCEHLLNVSCFEFDFVRLHYEPYLTEDGSNPEMAYVQEWTPEQYFSRIIAFYMDEEHGTDQIDEVVGQNVFFGKDLR